MDRKDDFENFWKAFQELDEHGVGAVPVVHGVGRLLDGSGSLGGDARHSKDRLGGDALDSRHSKDALADPTLDGLPSLDGSGSLDGLPSLDGSGSLDSFELGGFSNNNELFEAVNQIENNNGIGDVGAETADAIDRDDFPALVESIFSKAANGKQIPSPDVAKAIKLAKVLASDDSKKQDLLLTVVNLWQTMTPRPPELFDGSNARLSAVLGYFLLHIVTITEGRRHVRDLAEDEPFNTTFYSFVQFCTVYLLLRYGLQWHRSGMETQDRKFKQTFRNLFNCISLPDYRTIVRTLNMFNFKPQSRFHQAVVSLIAKHATDQANLGKVLCGRDEDEDRAARLTTVCLEHKLLRRHAVRDRSGKKNRDSWYPQDDKIPELLENHLPQKSRRHPDAMKDRFAALWYRKM